MAQRGMGYAFNPAKQAFVASRLRVADSHWTRLRGLMGTPVAQFAAGHGLWIVPSHGVHTFAMRFPIDVIYLDSSNTVIHIVENLQPWRVTQVRMDATSILEVPAHTIFQTGTAVGDPLEIVLGGNHGSRS